MKTKIKIPSLQIKKILKWHWWTAAALLLALNVFVLGFLARNAEKERSEHLLSVAGQIQYEIDRTLDDAVSVSDYLSMNDALSEFLLAEYESQLDYYEKFNDLLNDNLIKYYYTVQSVYSITIVTDNPTITNGQYFLQEEDAQKEEWYQNFLDSGRVVLVDFVYKEDSYSTFFDRNTQISVIRRMEAPLQNSVMRLEVDYTELRNNILNVAGEADFYIVDGGKILFTNRMEEASQITSANAEGAIFENMQYNGTISVIGNEWTLYLTDENYSGIIGSGDWLWLAMLLLMLDAGIPATVLIVNSKRKQERQKLELSRTMAELNALQSQVNPHFMFNTLESIRMHCVLNDEDETEEMLGKFARLLRQRTQWNGDFVSLESELRFVEEYLEIQKMRFGKRLRYEITAQEACRSVKVLRFGILTFVENACVHGIEKRVGGGMISVKVYAEQNKMYWEIEDTGIGMTQEKLENLRKEIAHPAIDKLQKSSHVGVLNVVIRLKLYYDQEVKITVDSKEGQGTKIWAELPLHYEKTEGLDERT